MSRLPILALLLAVLLGGCSPASRTQTLTLWHPWGGAELTALKRAIGDYQERHPGIEVLALQVPSDRLQDKYLRSTAANGGPDLLIGATDWIGRFAQSQVISALDADLDAQERARFLPVALDAMRFDGKLYAIPESMETLALYTNKRLLKTPPPRTLDELLAMADRWPKDYLLAYNTQFYFSAGYLFGFGGTLLDAKGDVRLAGRPTETWMHLLRTMKAHPHIAAKGDYGFVDALFREGKAALTVNGPWVLGDYEKLLGRDLGVAPLPMVSAQRPASPFVGVKCLMFNPNSSAESRKRALAFASDFTSVRNLSLMLKEAGHIPAVKGVAIPAGSPLEAFVAQAQLGTPLPPNPEMKEVWAPMDKAIDQVLTSGEAIPGVLEKTQELMAAKIEAVRKQ